MHRFLLSSLLLALVLATPAHAQAVDPNAVPLADLKAQLVAGKQSVVAHALGLTSEQETDFWPAYDALQAELGEITTKRREAKAAIAAGGDDAADGIEALVEADTAQARAYERAWSRLRGALPPATLARYLQLERRIAATELL